MTLVLDKPIKIGHAIDIRHFLTEAKVVAGAVSSPVGISRLHLTVKQLSFRWSILVDAHEKQHLG